MPDFLVQFDPDGRQVHISEQDNLLQAIAAVGIPLKASCGGEGTCNKPSLEDAEDDLGSGFCPISPWKNILISAIVRLKAPKWC